MYSYVVWRVLVLPSFSLALLVVVRAVKHLVLGLMQMLDALISDHVLEVTDICSRGSNIITDNGHGGTSSWNCTGWNGSILCCYCFVQSHGQYSSGYNRRYHDNYDHNSSSCQHFVLRANTCSTEDICKPAGQPCNTLCAVGSTVKWVDFSNLTLL